MDIENVAELQNAEHGNVEPFQKLSRYLRWTCCVVCEGCMCLFCCDRLNRKQTYRVTLTLLGACILVSIVMIVKGTNIPKYDCGDPRNQCTGYSNSTNCYENTFCLSYNCTACLGFLSNQTINSEEANHLSNFKCDAANCSDATGDNPYFSFGLIIVISVPIMFLFVLFNYFAPINSAEQGARC